jgi:hypothetical protein
LSGAPINRGAIAPFEDPPMNEHPELEALLTPLRSSFHAKRRDAAAQCEAIVRLTEGYLKAVDQRILHELAKSHGLPEVPLPHDPERLALELFEQVRTLPELRQRIEAASSVSAKSLPSAANTPPIRARNGETTSSQGGPSATPKRDSLKPPATTANAGPRSDATPSSPTPSNWPLVRQALNEHPLVIVGGPPHLERVAALAVDPSGRIEWIDTTRQGTHAIGNLERRIKDKRIAALLILEGLVQHRHSDPLVSTARSAKIPAAYGGKGGRSALSQAFSELERILQQRQSIAP